MNPEDQDKAPKRYDPEIMAYVHELVCQLFCNGLNPLQIVKEVKAKCGVELNQKQPHNILHQEHAKFRFLTTTYNALTDAIEREFGRAGRKLGVTVTSTNLQEDLVRRAAQTVWQLVQDRIRGESIQRVFSIGCSGGHTMKGWARAFRLVLRQPWETDLAPDKIVFKALVSGIDTDAAGTDPSSFFNYFSSGYDEGALVCETEFELLKAAPILPPRDHRRLRATGESDRPTISEAFRRDRRCDVIVTSAGELEDPHSQLRKCYEKYSTATLDRLRADNCVGDILWQPVNDYGVLDTSTHPFRTMALIDLTDLPDLIKRGTHVVLILGHCAGGCKLLRTRTLYLALRYHFVTDVVLTRETADSLLRLVRTIREMRSALTAEKPADPQKFLAERGVTDLMEQLLILSEAPALRP
jgi:hypothetical protein